MIILQGYILNFQKSILMNIRLFQRELGCNYDPTNIVLETYNYDVRFEKEESADITKGGEECADLPPMKKK